MAKSPENFSTEASRRPRHRPLHSKAAGHFTRTPRRHDYAVDPPTMRDVLAEKKIPVFGIGKIHDYTTAAAFDDYVTTSSNTTAVIRALALPSAAYMSVSLLT